MTDVDDKTAPLGSLGLGAETDRAPNSGLLGQLVDSDVETDELRLLDPSEIRARRRPRAILVVWAWELACSLLIALPVHVWANKVWGTHPDGDAVLFQPGGHALLSWLGDDGPALSIVVRTTLVTLLVLGTLGQLVTGMLIASLASGRGRLGLAPKTSVTLRAGASTFLPFVGIGLIEGAAQGAVIGIGALVSSSVDRSLAPSLGDARSFAMRMVVLSLFVLVAAILGVVADLVRVAFGRRAVSAPPGARASFGEAVRVAVRTARHAIGRATLAWGWRAAIGVGLIWLGALAGDVTGARGGAFLWLLFVVHQLLLLLRATLRASWLANALRLVLRSGGTA